MIEEVASVGKGVVNTGKEVKRFSSEINGLKEESLDDKSAEKALVSHVVEIGGNAMQKAKTITQDKKENKRMSLKDRAKAGREYAANKEKKIEKTVNRNLKRDDLSL